MVRTYHYQVFFIKHIIINPLSAKFIKWSNTLKQIVGKLPTICLSVFDHFSEVVFKGLNILTSSFRIFIVLCCSEIDHIQM